MPFISKYFNPNFLDSKDLFSLALVNKNLYRITKDFRVGAKCLLKKDLFDQVAKMALSLEMTLMPYKAYSQDRPVFSLKAPISEKSLKHLFYFSLPESQLIEIAGASGETALGLAHLVNQVKINDVEEAQIKEGKELFLTLPENIQQKIEFIVGDFFQTSFEEESVDVVICRNFINLLTVKGSDRLLALIHRMLRPGGVVFLEGQKEIFVQNGEELAKHCQKKSVVWLKTLYFTPKGQKQKETLLQSVYIEEDQKSTGNFLPIHSIESVGKIAEGKVQFSKEKIALTQKDLHEIRGICCGKREGSLEQSLKVKRVFTSNYMKRYLQRGGFKILEMYEEQAKRSFGSWALEKKSICAFSQKPFISETKSNQS